ncbi:MAG: hypothetical protein HPPSJP_0580 [Candidatus Hepatoplasma scabrum]|nr:MAG: hypothetical protein HPPSJP_0580 [Candidatus Hepatoplasma sp.]
MFTWIILTILIILLIFFLLYLIKVYFFKNKKQQTSHIEKYNVSILIDLNRMVLITIDDKNNKNYFDFEKTFERLEILDPSKNNSFLFFLNLLLSKDQKIKNSVIRSKIKKFLNNEYTFFSKSLISDFGYFGVLKVAKFDTIKRQITIMSYGYRTSTNHFQDYIYKTKIYKEQKSTDYEIFKNFYEKTKTKKDNYNLSIIKDLTLSNINNLYNKFLIWGLKAFFSEYENVNFYIDNFNNLYFLTKGKKTKNELLINNYYIEKFNLIKFRFNQQMRINFDFSGFKIASAKIIKNTEEMFDFAFCQIQTYFDNIIDNKQNNYQKIMNYANEIINYSYSKKDGVNLEMHDNYFLNKSIVIISINFLNKNVEEINSYTIFKKYAMLDIFFKSILNTIKDKKIRDYLISVNLSTFSNLVNYFDNKKLKNHQYVLENSYWYLIKNELEIKNINWNLYSVYLLQDNFWFDLDIILVINPKIIFVSQNYLDNFENNQIQGHNLNGKYLNLLDIKENYKEIEIKKI